MLIKSCIVALATVFALAGCASQADSEPTATDEHAIIGALTSPIGFADHHLVGTWEPVDAAHFRGDTSDINFAQTESGRLTYRMGKAACDAPCTTDGTSWVTQNPLVWFFAGTYVEFHGQNGQERSLFVSRGLDGEITLVDLDSWDWSLGRHTNTWRRTPPLTVNELWH